MGLFSGLVDAVFGGGSGGGSSSSSTAASNNPVTTTSTTNTSNQDNRLWDYSYRDNSVRVDNSQRYEIDASQDNRSWFDYNVDNRQTFDINASQDNDIGSGAIVAGGNVSVLDGGAVASSFDFARQLAQLFSGNTTAASSRAFESADSMAAANVRTTGQAFDLARYLGDLFSTGTQRTTGQAFDLARALSSDTAGASRAAFDANTRTTGQAFDLVDSVVGRLSADVTGSAQRTTAGAFDLARYVTDGVTAGASRTTGQAFDLAGRMADSNTAFLGGVLSKTFSAQEQVTNLVAGAYNDAKGRGAMTDQLLLAAVAGSVLLAFVALRKR